MGIFHIGILKRLFQLNATGINAMQQPYENKEINKE